MLITLIGIVAVDYFVQYFNNSKAAIVNGSRISNKELDNRLRENYAAEVLDALINEELIRQEAKSQGVKVTQDQINQEYQKIVDSYPDGEEELIKELEAQYITVADLMRRIELRLQAEALIAPTLKEPTDDEVKEYYDLKYSYLEADQRPKLEDEKESLISEIQEQKLQSEIVTLIQSLGEKATVQNNITDKPEYKFLGLTQTVVQSVFKKK